MRGSSLTLGDISSVCISAEAPARIILKYMSSSIEHCLK